MKKYIIIFTAIVIIVSVILFTEKVILLDKDTTNYTNRIEYNIDGLRNIDLEQFLEVVNQSNSLIYISNSMSHYDSSFAEKLKQLKEETGIEIFVLDIINIDVDSSDYKKFQHILEKAKDVYNKKYNQKYDTLEGITPVLILSNKLEIKDVLIGDQDYTNIKNWIE